ncbi:MAG: c-type cytochrome biogenesis protein CcmI [Nitrospira sp.]|nr:c-type cytochrome biogenesis protein CcmI [Nitrospira sp.]MCP9460606.1 c-type cytochrome biogenesis protein CcmI [Nitrospira sp.]MCP9475126.1 c-type cytochrome biogenesis protein CcmI [Nitrospira sp.]
MTLTFGLIATALIVIILGVLLRPLLKQAATGTGVEREKTLPVYRQQFAELEQDKSSGLLTEEQYLAARQELERRLLEEVGVTEKGTTAARPMNVKYVAAALVVLIPMASGGLYWSLGNPLAMTHPAAGAFSASQGDVEDDRLMAEGLNTLIERLKQKLEQNPDDVTGWTLLARSYMAMDRYAEAVPIFEKAVTLNPNDAGLLADYADALGVHQGRKLEGKPEVLIQKALRLDPNNVKALMLSGTVAFNRKDFASAVKDWELARANLPPNSDPESTEQLMASINEAKRRMGGAPLMAMANAALAESSVPADHPPIKKRGGSHAITGKVILGPGMEAKSSGADTLFVFAKDPNGPPMPVSIVRATKKDLPFTFRLDDSTSPMPSRKLSDLETVVIVARLSRSGTAMPGSGDLEGMSQPIKPGTEGITIVIDRQRP